MVESCLNVASRVKSQRPNLRQLCRETTKLLNLFFLSHASPLNKDRGGWPLGCRSNLSTFCQWRWVDVNESGRQFPMRGNGYSVAPGLSSAINECSSPRCFHDISLLIALRWRPTPNPSHHRRCSALFITSPSFFLGISSNRKRARDRKQHN